MPSRAGSKQGVIRASRDNPGSKVIIEWSVAFGGVRKAVGATTFNPRVYTATRSLDGTIPEIRVVAINPDHALKRISSKKSAARKVAYA